RRARPSATLHEIQGLLRRANLMNGSGGGGGSSRGKEWLPSSPGPRSCHPVCSLSSRKAGRKQAKDLCIPRLLHSIEVLALPSPGNTWVLRRESLRAAKDSG